MSALWASDELANATLGRATHAFEAHGLSIDTRTLGKGDLFVALRGENRDGHDFVRAAIDAGAAGALATHRPSNVPETAPLLLVAHTQRALEDLGGAARLRSNAKIVAVTGSAGKTTTKEILRCALGALGKTHASVASYNNHWGVPLSLAAMPRECVYGIFEVGMNHFGEIRTLVGFVRPHVVLITTIAPAHLEFFGNEEAIADAKSEIFEGLAPGGTALVPSDSAQCARLLARAKRAHVGRSLTFGAGPGSDAKLISTENEGDGQRIRADIMGKPVEAFIGAPGAHIAANAVGALAAVAALDGDVFNAAAALRNFTALKGRGARIAAGGVSIIDESYNANPTSMQAALALLAQARGRRVAVLGDMLELGASAAELHSALAGPIEAARVDVVFASGRHMKALWEALPAMRRGAYAESSAQLAPLVAAAVATGDTVLVKGSNGSKMSIVMDALKARGA